DRVGVLAQEERPVDPALPAVLADRLRRRQDVRLGEAAVVRRAAVTARAEGDELLRIADVGLTLVVRALQRRDVDQLINGCELPGERMRHRSFVLQALVVGDDPASSARWSTEEICIAERTPRSIRDEAVGKRRFLVVTLETG